MWSYYACKHFYEDGLIPFELLLINFYLLVNLLIAYSKYSFRPWTILSVTLIWTSNTFYCYILSFVCIENNSAPTVQYYLRLFNFDNWTHWQQSLHETQHKRVIANLVCEFETLQMDSLGEKNAEYYRPQSILLYSICIMWKIQFIYDFKFIKGDKIVYQCSCCSMPVLWVQAVVAVTHVLYEVQTSVSEDLVWTDTLYGSHSTPVLDDSYSSWTVTLGTWYRLQPLVSGYQAVWATLLHGSAPIPWKLCIINLKKYRWSPSKFKSKKILKKQ